MGRNQGQDDELREYRDLAEQAGDVVTRSDERAVYTYVSSACRRVYGFEPEQMVGRPVHEFVHPDDHAARLALREALAAGSDEEVAERRMRTAAGGWVWVETRCRALRDDGRLVGVQASARDITDRRIAQEQFRTAFDDALVGIALVALDGSWLRVNQALCDIVGRRHDELYRMTFQDITHPEDLDADVALLEQTLAGERAGYQMEKRYLRPDGEMVSALLSVRLVRGAACIVEALDREFRERPAVIEGREVTARPSIGVAALEPELDVDAALRRADQAMYAVKRARRAT